MNEFIKHYGINEKGIDYAVGDIHGTYSRLDERLDQIGFNREIDRLFVPGDLVDRGMENEEVMNWLDKPWFFAGRGNHDQMAIDCVADMYDYYMYSNNGGGWFMKLPKDRQAQIAKAFEALPFAMTVLTAKGKIGLIHADPVFNDWNDLEARIHEPYVQQAALWERRTAQGGANPKYHSDVANIRAVICGHTPFKEPRQYGNVFFIDTGAVFNGVFTILRLDSLEYA